MDTEALRERSAAVFGNRYFAEVVVAIESQVPTADSAITVRKVASRSGLADGLVKLAVTRLVKADLLKPLPAQRPRGPRPHQVVRAGGRWAALVQLCTRLRDEQHSSSTLGSTTSDAGFRGGP
jgi:hypothetical protein